MKIIRLAMHMSSRPSRVYFYDYGDAIISLATPKLHVYDKQCWEEVI